MLPRAVPPDWFLNAARAEGVIPEHCIVVEKTAHEECKLVLPLGCGWWASALVAKGE